MRKTMMIFIMAGLVFILGCSQNAEVSQPQAAVQSEADEGMETVVIEEEKISEETPGSKEVKAEETIKEFTMTARRFDFSPSTIIVDKGDRVRIKISAVDVAHGFAIDEYNINRKFSPGEEEVIEFVADKSGTFEFYCSVFCGSGHRDMKGTLIVK